MSTDSMPILIEDLPVRKQSLRIAVVTETYPPEINGVANTVAQVVEGLRRRDHQIQLVRPRQAPHEIGSEQTDLHQTLTGSLPIPRYPSLKMGMPARRALTRLWTQARPDVVHVVTEGPLGWSAIQSAIRLGIPVVSDFRTNFHAYSKHYGVGWLRKPILGYLRKFHNRTACTMVPTEGMRLMLCDLGFHNVRVIARGVDTHLFSPVRRSRTLRVSWGAEEHAPVILHAGRLASEKNPEALIHAHAQIRQRVPTARFVIVGDGPARAYLEQHCPGAVFAGSRTGEDLAAHFASADIFLFPSLTETFGNVTLEAMASGLAVVAFDYGAAGKYIRHGANGLLAQSEDPAAFQRLALDLAGNLSLARSLGASAAIDTQALSWDSIVLELEGVLRATSTHQQPGDRFMERTAGQFMAR